MWNTDKAECTSYGPLGSYDGIRLTLNPFSAIEKRFRTLRLQFMDPETREAGIENFPYRHSSNFALRKKVQSRNTPGTIALLRGINKLPSFYTANRGLRAFL
jgi:hypothetical protein